ncbi:hypothetical protein BDN70DRAFT_895595 [Pholiota conissans]|uniref:Uncharacterized protein n=1 Tax=Pholiota conissans TaxID=109636 RepID=A0A9P5Z0W1_9AGAR|nr:hypothetical protein BDN70DRAFT_895595 [Pholiota conissans]
MYPLPQHTAHRPTHLAPPNEHTDTANEGIGEQEEQGKTQESGRSPSGAAATLHLTPSPPGCTPSPLMASAAAIIACHVPTAAMSLLPASLPAALPSTSTATTTTTHHLLAAPLAPTLATICSHDVAGTTTASSTDDKHRANDEHSMLVVGSVFIIGLVFIIAAARRRHKASKYDNDSKRGKQVTRDKQDPVCTGNKTACTTCISKRSSSKYDNDACGGEAHNVYSYDMQWQVARARLVLEGLVQSSFLPPRGIDRDLDQS